MNHNCPHDHGSHTNGFVDLNGVPYLLGEYLDRNQFQQIDRSLIKSDIFIDQSECMRALIDISVDDIGKRADGYPSISGNATKQKRLMKMIERCVQRMDHHFDTLRGGIVLRVNYRIENSRTHLVERSTVEDFYIPHRNYFIDINPRNVDDNAVVCNFNSTMVSSVTNFTHGRDQMILRITNVQMFYECMKHGPKVPRNKPTMHKPPMALNDAIYGSPYELYQYHNEMQSTHYMYQPDACGGYHEPNHRKDILPDFWYEFNRFYHFDQRSNDMVLHMEEINDERAQVALIPCGNVHVNRAFMINPGHRLIFRFNIWKNDVTVVNDIAPIARLIRAPMYYGGWRPEEEDYHPSMYDENLDILPNEHSHPHVHHEYRPKPTPALDKLTAILMANEKNDREQAKTIDKLTKMVEALTGVIKESHPDVEIPEIEEPAEEEIPNPPPYPPYPPFPPPPPPHDCNCDCDEEHEEIQQQIDELKETVNNTVAGDQVEPISEELIKQIVAEAAAEDSI